MEHVFTPSLCKPSETNEPAKYAGTVTVRLYDFDKRMELGDLVSGLAKSDGVKVVREMVAASRPQYVNVNIRRLSDNKLYESFDSLSYDAALGNLLIEVASGLVNGFGGNL